MTTSKELQDNFKLLKAGLDGFKEAKKKAEDGLIDLAKTLSGTLKEQAQGILKIIGDGEARAKKSIWAEQDKAVALINQGLAAIEEKHNESIAQIHRKTDVDLAAIQQAREEAIAAIRAERAKQ